jgi:cell division septation protein DedD
MSGGVTKMNRLAIAIASVGLFGVALSPAAKADEWNKKTILTVNEPIQVPNKVLPPGKYVMKLLDSQSNRHIVQIFNADETHLETTVLAIPNYRLEPTGKTQFQFWETPPGQPKALRAWFYPGDNFGQEFAYPKGESTQIASYAKQPVPTTYAQSEADLTTARVGTVNQQGTEEQLPAQTYSQNQAQSTPAPAQTPQPDMAQTTTPTQTPAATNDEANRAMPQATTQSLPKTGSVYPLIGLVGLFSLLAFVTLRVVRAS